jgi:predicted metalloendopeptidase
MQVVDGDYYRTKFTFYNMYQQDVLERISVPVDRERYINCSHLFSFLCVFRWVAGAALVNAFYSPNTNEISQSYSFARDETKNWLLRPFD